MCPHGTLLVDKTCYSGMSLVMFIQTTLGILHSALSLASLYSTDIIQHNHSKHCINSTTIAIPVYTVLCDRYRVVISIVSMLTAPIWVTSKFHFLISSLD